MEAAARAGHLAECADCAARIEEELALASNLALALQPVAPSPPTWARLAGSLDGRFARFTARCAELLDIAAEKARALLEAADGPDGWIAGLPGVSIFHLEGGPAVEGAITGFIRLEPGAVFAEHLHLGDEVNLVLQGGLQSSDGKVAWAGQELAMPAGSRHTLSALPGAPLIYLGVSLQGIEMAGEPVGPDDPRA